MIIKKVRLAKLRIPLIRPFITALRKTDHIEDVVVNIETECGKIGYGSAAATHVITGDSLASMVYAIDQVFAPKLIGRSLDEFDNLMNLLPTLMVNNSSAKAALDIALYDLFAQKLQLPLYKLLGGNQNTFQSAITISVKSVEEMVKDAKEFCREGFTTLKLKVGVDAKQDIARIKAIREAVGPSMQIIIDANQGWTPKAALAVINKIEQLDLNIVLVEQPVKAKDLSGLKFIRDRVTTLIFADESIFSPHDALNIIAQDIADGLNIKLMKTGGIYQANIIYGMANSHNIPCLAGCMLESPIGITAMTSFVSSKTGIKFIDLDAVHMIKRNPVRGGVTVHGSELRLSEKPGLGVEHVDGLEYIE